jgi:hypothetical protein
VITPGLDLFKNRLRMTAQLDYRGGHKVYNNTDRIRCASRNNCQALFDVNAPLEDQARRGARARASEPLGGRLHRGR